MNTGSVTQTDLYALLERSTRAMAELNKRMVNTKFEINNKMIRMNVEQKVSTAAMEGMPGSRLDIRA